MKKLVLLTLLCPTLAFASDCEHVQPRSLALELDGVRTVRIEVNSHELRLGPVRDGEASFTARACASDPAGLCRSVWMDPHRVRATAGW